MTARGLRRLHLVLVVVILAVGVSTVGARAAGLLGPQQATLLLVAVELPLVLAVLALGLLRLRGVARRARESGRRSIDLLVREEGVVRIALAELRTLAALVTLARGRCHGVGPGVRGFGYVRGTLQIPIALLVVAVLETAAVHLLIPWDWLRIPLLLASVYGIVLLAGVLAARVVHPHLVGGDSVTLRWGHATVLTVPLGQVSEVARVVHHAHTQAALAEEQLVLTALVGTNVRLRLDAPHEARLGRATGPVREVLLHVADPEGFVGAVEEERARRPSS